MRKSIVLLYSIMLALFSSANMASPISEGTLGSRPFVNQFVDVVHEDLLIRIDKKFHRAHFNIKYHINASKTGVNIPFLFYASEYMDGFTVKIDGKEIEIQAIQEDIYFPAGAKFDNFSYIFEDSDHRDKDFIGLNNGDYSFQLRLRDMLFFETDISEGEHIIEVNYNAEHWKDRSDWMNKYSFRYALSPAKYWKSFGTLTVTLDATQFKESMNSNLGQPAEGSIDSVAIWKFDSLPMDVAQWNFNPEKSSRVETLINISPLGLASILGVILAILHFSWVYWYRKRNPTKKFSLALIFGSIFVPLIFVLSWINFFGFIDALIGEHAGRYHGYVFLYIILYPVILLIYWVIFWLIDRDFKNGLYARKKP